MKSEKAQGFIRDYLASTRGDYALEASVLAMGERKGFSEKRLREAASRLGIVVDRQNATWELPRALRGPRPAGRIRSSRHFRGGARVHNLA